jgi:hypothetical protein
MMLDETVKFLKCLYERDGYRVIYLDEEFDLSVVFYGKDPSNCRYGLADSFGCQILNKLAYCVFDSYYYRQMCKAADLIIDEAYKLILSVTGIKE